MRCHLQQAPDADLFRVLCHSYAVGFPHFLAPYWMNFHLDFHKHLEKIH
jgi:hypothetical protein